MLFSYSLVILAASTSLVSAFPAFPYESQALLSSESSFELASPPIGLARLAALTASLKCSSIPVILFPSNATGATSSQLAPGSLSIVQPSHLSTMSLLGHIDPRFKESVFASLVPLQNDGFFSHVSTSVQVLQGAREAFEREADRLLAKVQTLVMRKGSEVERIEISGHGLGASIALLHAVHLASSLRSTDIPINVYMFAPVRIGNAAFSSYLLNLGSQLRTHIIASPQDPISRLPYSDQGFRPVPAHRTWSVDSQGVTKLHNRDGLWSALLKGTDGESLRGSVISTHLGPVEGTMFADTC